MGIDMENVHIKNGGTGVKAEGKVDISMKNMIFENNEKDIDLEVTKDSKIKIQNIIARGTKEKSISVKEYHNSLNQIKELISERANLSSNDKDFIIKKIEEIGKSKDPGLIKKTIEKIKSKAKDEVSKQVVNLLITGLEKILF